MKKGAPQNAVITPTDSSAGAATLRASVSAAGDTGVGDLREMCVVTDRMTALLTAITPEYFLFAALGPDALAGRARYALRVAGLTLQPEFV